MCDLPGRAVAGLRSSPGEAAFGEAWADGAALAADEAVSYALRGRGERTRPAVGVAVADPRRA